MPFEKGKSGNPSGKPNKLNNGVIEARKHAEAAMARLGKEIHNEDANIAIKAANSILDRAWGKPKEHVEHSGDVLSGLIELITGRTEGLPNEFEGTTGTTSLQ